MVVRLWELQSNLSLKDAASSTEGITRSSVNYLRKRKSQHSQDLLHSYMNQNTFVDSSFFSNLFHCFSILSALLYSKPIQISRCIAKSLIATSTCFLLKRWKIKLEKCFLDPTVCLPKPIYLPAKWPEYVTDYNYQLSISSHLNWLS